MCQSLFDLGANDCKKLSADCSDIPGSGVQLRWGANEPATGKLPSYTFPYPLKKTENFPGKSIPNFFGSNSRKGSGPPKLNSIRSVL